ncbi:MAG: hypothetical protein D6778_04395 [Nitrospirae bacterium]|nr:MAG: hypothetical protein D6778_04395 [Nitrospirota bacterium]
MKTGYLLTIGFVLLFVWGCGPVVVTKRARSEELTGRYDLILYGGNYMDDPETIGFVDIKDDTVEFRPYAPDYKFKIIKDIPGKRALEYMKGHLYAQSDVLSIEIRKIFSPEGELLGFELRPLYEPFKYGMDTPEVHYQLKGKRLIIYVNTPWALEEEDDDFNRHRIFSP